MGLVAGVLFLNLVLTAVGYCVLAAPLRGLSLPAVASYAGLALLVGAGTVGLAVCAVAVTGITLGLPVFVVCAALVAAAGIGALRLPRSARARFAAPPAPQRPPLTRIGDVVATVAAAGVAIVAGSALVGGFRSSPWLDDIWFFFVAKSVALHEYGLDARMFAQDQTYEFFYRNDNPLWWPVVLGWDLDFVGALDLRAVNAQLTILVVAFVGAAARLLWGWVRPSILWPALLLTISAPELLRQAQGGTADVVMALYIGLALLAAVLWLARPNGFSLLLVGLLGAVAAAVKGEGLPQLLLFVGVASAVGWAVRRRAPLALWVAVVAAIAASAPWYVWRAVVGVPNVFSFRDALNPSYLAGRTDLLKTGADTLISHMLDPRQWTVIVLLLVTLCLVGLVRERRAIWLAPVLIAAAGYTFWVWVAWADPESEFRLVYSAYRYVVPTVLVSALAIPLVAERLMRSFERGARDAPDGRG